MKSQATTSVKLALDELDALVDQKENDAQSLFLRGCARKFHLSLSLPCPDYDDRVLEYLTDMVSAVQLEPQNGEFVARLAKEKLEYTLELEVHCVSVGESLQGDSLVAQSVALSWQHTLEIARSALAINDLKIENKRMALAALSQALLASGHVNDCSASIENWILASGDCKMDLADALSFKGVFQEAQGDVSSALDSWDLALKSDPQHLDTLVKKATALRNAGRSADAIVIWEQLSELHPDNADFPYRAAADFEITDQHAQSIASLKKCLLLNKKHLFALNDLAFHYISAASWKEAMPLLQEVLSQGPGDDIPWINMANVLFHLGDYDQALRSINNALSAKRVGDRPASAEEWLIKVAILRALNRQPEAPSNVDQDASSSAPQDTSSGSSAEFTVEEVKKTSKSDLQADMVKCFVNAMKAVDKLELAQAYFEYADYLIEAGQPDQARAKIQLSLKLKPSASIELLNLTRIDLQPETISLFNEMQKK